MATSTKAERHWADGGWCMAVDPIYEMGSAYPVGYVQSRESELKANPLDVFPGDEEWLAKKRAAIWYECENCGWATHASPNGEYTPTSHQCPDGTIPDRFVVMKPFDEFAAGEALKGLLKILDDQTVA